MLLELRAIPPEHAHPERRSTMTAVLPARILDDVLAFDHERVVAAIGERSGLAMIVAVHSTKLGPALGGCRLWSYDSWADGLADALRLSRGMTSKNALA